jgi:uncharacterized membrane protein
MTESWINAFYRLLNQFGFPDPLHAALVHMPIGLVMGAALFGWLGLRPGRERFGLTARDCAVLALLFWFPAVLFGFTDWQHFYHGVWMNPITVKLILAGVLGVLLAAALFLAFRRPMASGKVVPLLYTLCLVTVVLLGWFGARLVYDGKPGGQGEANAYSLGEKVFADQCKCCHPGGGNLMRPDRPLIGSGALKSPEAFIALIRRPPEPMPAFAPSVLSDGDARELYRYVTNVLARSGRQGGNP